MNDSKYKQSKSNKFIKKIGGTTYKVTVNFSKTSHENIKDKILRLIKNDVANSKHS